MKKEYTIAGVIGLITGLFATVILTNTDAVLGVGSFRLPLWSPIIILPILEFIGYLVASKLFSHIQILKQFGRFAIVGLMNFSVDTGILSSLGLMFGVVAGSGLIPLNAVSATVAIVNSYFWNRTWTFAEKAPPTRKEFFIFLLVSIIGIVINSFVVVTLTSVIPPFDGFTPERILVVSKVGATIVSLMWTFTGYKFIVFK